MKCEKDKPATVRTGECGVVVDVKKPIRKDTISTGQTRNG